MADDKSGELIPAEAPLQKYVVKEAANPRWSSHFKNKMITVARKPLFGPEDKIFTIGSCFAERIRSFLTAEGFKVGPPTDHIPMAPDRYNIDRLPRYPHLDYYNTFTIRQEFERHIGEWAQDPDDYWTIKDPLWEGEVAYQDPYRRATFGRTPEDLLEAVRHTDDAIDRGIREADVFFMTMGMAEVFRNKQSGKIACQKPGYAKGGGEEQTEFHMSSYEENYANLRRIVEIITQVRPEARIVFTVSPVPLARTFSDNDIVAANTEGKSILRAAIGAIARDFDAVTYFPSYELVMANSPFSWREDDGRHVDNWIVSRIVKTFKAAHCTTG